MSISWIQRALPDPYAPVIAAGGGRSTSVASLDYRSAQRRRRANILAHARMLIGANGYDRVSMRQLAERCDISVQTVYNLVGDRSEVLGKAINEHILSMGQSASMLEGYPSLLLAMADTYGNCAARNPEFIAQATIAYFVPDSPLFDQVNRCNNRLMLPALRELARQGRLRESVDCELLTGRIAAQVSATVLHWAQQGYDIPTLQRELLAGCSLLLMGAMRGAEADVIDEWLARRLSSPPFTDARPLTPVEGVYRQ